MLVSSYLQQVKGKEAEMDSVLAMKPQRLGHALYLTPAQVRPLPLSHH